MKKRGARSTEMTGDRESSSPQFYQDEDFQSLKDILSRLKTRYHLTTTDILNLTQEEVLIPCSIFLSKLSPLETIVKYLKENIGLNYTKIESLLGRDRKTLWQAHKNAAAKFPEQLKPEETQYSIPVSVFKSDLSVLEAVVTYLKDHFALSYHQIGELLERNERTIWTVYNRGQKKHA